MSQSNSSDPRSPRKTLPKFFGNTPLWRFMSALKLSLKRMRKTAPYWGWANLAPTFRYFMAVEQPGLRGDVLNWFQFDKFMFGLRPMEWHIMDAIILENEYELIRQAFPEQAPAIIIDAGANVGLFSIYALSLWPSANIFAIEAGPETYAILKENQSRNPAFTWHTHHYALWGHDGTVSFESKGLSMASHVAETSSEPPVPAIRLDSYIKQFLPPNGRVSLLKMDIEGAEETVLKTAPAVLDQVDLLLIEIHPDRCDENSVRAILKEKFAYHYNISSPTSHYPLVLVGRRPVQVTGVSQTAS